MLPELKVHCKLLSLNTICFFLLRRNGCLQKSCSLKSILNYKKGIYSKIKSKSFSNFFIRPHACLLLVTILIFRLSGSVCNLCIMYTVHSVISLISMRHYQEKIWNRYLLTQYEHKLVSCAVSIYSRYNAVESTSVPLKHSAAL